MRWAAKWQGYSWIDPRRWTGVSACVRLVERALHHAAHEPRITFELIYRRLRFDRGQALVPHISVNITLLFGEDTRSKEKLKKASR